MQMYEKFEKNCKKVENNLRSIVRLVKVFDGLIHKLNVPNIMRLNEPSNEASSLYALLKRFEILINDERALERIKDFRDLIANNIPNFSASFDNIFARYQQFITSEEDNENSSDSLQQRLTDLTVEVNDLDKEIINSIVEISSQMLSVYKDNYQEMIEIANHFTRIQAKINNKIVSIVNETSTSESLPPRDETIINLSSLSVIIDDNTNQFDLLNNSNLDTESPINVYKYTQMDSLFVHDLSLNFDSEDYKQINYVTFLKNRTNIKTFTNNRVLVGSLKKDFITIFMLSATFSEERGIPDVLKFVLKRKSQVQRLYQVLNLNSRYICFSNKEFQQLYLNKKTDGDRLDFLNSFQHLELEFRLTEEIKTQLALKNMNIILNLISISTPYILDVDWKLEAVKLNHKNSIKCTLRLEFLHLPEGNILVEFELPSLFDDPNNPNRKYGLSVNYFEDDIKRKVKYNEETKTFKFQLYFEDSNGTDGFKFDSFYCISPETLKSNQNEDFVYDENLYKLFESKCFVSVSVYFITNNPLEIIDYVEESEFSVFEQFTPRLGILEFIHSSRLNDPRSKQTNLALKIKELTEKQSFQEDDENDDSDEFLFVEKKSFSNQPDGCSTSTPKYRSLVPIPSNNQTELNPEPMPKPKSELNPDQKLGPKSELNPWPKSKLNPEPMPKPKSELNPDQKLGPKSELKPKPTDLKPIPSPTELNSKACRSVTEIIKIFEENQKNANTLGRNQSSPRLFNQNLDNRQLINLMKLKDKLSNEFNEIQKNFNQKMPNKNINEKIVQGRATANKYHHQEFSSKTYLAIQSSNDWINTMNIINENKAQLIVTIGMIENRTQFWPVDTQHPLFFDNLTVKFIKETRKDIREYWLEDSAAKTSRKIWHFDYKDWSADQWLPDAIQLKQLITSYDEFGAPFYSANNKKFLDNLKDLFSCISFFFSKVAGSSSSRNPIVFLTNQDIGQLGSLISLDLIHEANNNLELKEVVQSLCSKEKGFSKIVVNQQQYEMLGLISKILKDHNFK